MEEKERELTLKDGDLHKMFKKLKVDPQNRKELWRRRKHMQIAYGWHRYQHSKATFQLPSAKKQPLVRPSKFRLVKCRGSESYQGNLQDSYFMKSFVNTDPNFDGSFSFTCPGNFNLGQPNLKKNTVSRRKRLHPSDDKFQKKRMALKVGGAKDLILTEGINVSKNRSKMPPFRKLATIAEEKPEDFSQESICSCPGITSHIPLNRTGRSMGGVFSRYNHSSCSSFASVLAGENTHRPHMPDGQNNFAGWNYRNSGRTIGGWENHQNISMPRQTCAQQARRSQDVPLDDTTVEELAGYFDDLVHIPRKMSAMAEMMYT